MPRFIVLIPLIAFLAIPFVAHAEDPQVNLPKAAKNAWERQKKAVLTNRETYDKNNGKALENLKKELAKLNPPVEADEIVQLFQQEVIVKLDAEAVPPPPPPPDKDIVVFNGHRYKLFMDKKTRAEAERQCAALGGFLMTIEGKQEHGFLVPRLREFLQSKDNLNDNQYVWIGVRYDKQAKTLVDRNNAPVTFGEFEPTHPKADSEFVAMKMVTGRLFSFGKDSELPFVCEWDK